MRRAGFAAILFLIFLSSGYPSVTEVLRNSEQTTVEEETEFEQKVKKIAKISKIVEWILLLITLTGLTVLVIGVYQLLSYFP